MATKAVNEAVTANKAGQDYQVVDTPEAVAALIDFLLAASQQGGQLFVDLEGISLSRHGSISWIQIHVTRPKNTFLVDVHVLNTKAFTTPATDGKTTLRDILESTTIIKYFFDVRNDSDGLSSLFGITLAGVRDIQLLEISTRTFPKTYVCGLAKCIERDCPMPAAAKQVWLAAKSEVTKLFDPKLGGSYEVFNKRPPVAAVLDYCVQDVEALPLLAKYYESRLTSAWSAKVDTEIENRLKISRAANYDPKAESKKFAPKAWH